MNATKARCLCSHSSWRHLAERYKCRSRACGCTEYRTSEESFPAALEGDCRLCDTAIEIGDEVAFYRDDTGVMDVGHDRCIDANQETLR